MKLVIGGVINEIIACPLVVARQWEYVSNYFDDATGEDDEEKTLELPMMVQDKEIVERMIEFSVKNKDMIPVPKMSLEKAKDVMKIIPLENIGTNYDLNFVFNKLEIPDWCLEFFSRQEIEKIFELTRYADLVGFKDLLNLCIINIASLYMTKVMNQLTEKIFSDVFTVREKNRLRKEILS